MDLCSLPLLGRGQPGKWSYVEVDEDLILCLLPGFEVKKGVVSGVGAKGRHYY